MPVRTSSLPCVLELVFKAAAVKITFIAAHSLTSDTKISAATLLCPAIHDQPEQLKI